MKRVKEIWDREEAIARVEGWVRDGCTQAEIAKRMEVSPTTLWRLRKSCPALEAALKNGREEADRMVEKALLKRALGYEYTETTWEENARESGKRKVTTKHVPPDLSAQIFWLKNRRPEAWRDKPAQTSEEKEGVMMLDVISWMSPAFYTLHREITEGKIDEAILRGGRGSGKSSFISLEILSLLLRHPECHAVILRKVADTLRTSVYAQMRWAITALSLDALFELRVSPMQISYKPTGQTIYFYGLDDPGKLKSIKTPFGYTGMIWFEELDQYAGAEEIRSVEQSVLRGGDFTFIFKSFNPPASARNWTNAYVREEKARRTVHTSTYLETPRAWLGEKFIADAQRLLETNETAYRHEYLGEITGNGTAVFENILEERISQEQIETFDRVYRGVDWGYYPDPFAYVECHFDAARRKLYIFGELTAWRMGNAQTAEMIKARGRTEMITADSAEPKSIADYKACGIACTGARKGPGSIEHGMKWLSSLEAIVIDPVRCPQTLKEFTQYEYERGKNGETVAGYPDVYNHHIDAVRYALESVRTRRVARAERR